MTWGTVLGAVFLACVTTAADGSLADGHSCEASKACKSHICNEGFCNGSGDCTVSPDGGSSGCEPGWQCVSSKGSIFFSGSIDCIPLCGACPGNSHCKFDQQDSGARCEDGPPRKVTIAMPDTVKVDSDVTLSVTVDPPFDETYGVYWYIGEKAGDQAGEFGPMETTITTKLPVTIEGDFVVSVVLQGKIKRPGQPDAQQTAEGTKLIHHACLAEGEVCQDHDSSSEPIRCCTAGTYCAGQTGSTAPRICTKDRN